MNHFIKNILGQRARVNSKNRRATVQLQIADLEARVVPANTVVATFDFADRVLRIEGTEFADSIRVVNNAGQVSVSGLAIRSTNSGPVWTNVASIAATDIGYMEVRTLAGNDLVQIVEQSVTPDLAVRTAIHGQQGNDTLNGGSAADGLYGGTGNDVLNGNGGADVIEGGYSTDVVSELAAQLDRDLDFYSSPDNIYEFEDSGGRGEKWLYGATPDWGYFILPNGELYQWDNTWLPDGTDTPALVDEAKVFFGWEHPERTPAASGTLIATLDPSYHQHLLKLANANVLRGAPLVQDPFGMQAQRELDRDLGLAVEGEENFYDGQMERWLVDGRVPFDDRQDNDFQFIMPNGELYLWDGNWEALGGTLIATFDASYYQELTKLTDAKYLFGDLTDNDTASGGAGNDTVIGGDGADSLNGGLDNDRLIGGNDNDSLRGEAGNDELIGCHYGFAGETGNPNDTILGNAGDDSLYGGDGADVMEGDNGNDYLKGDGGNDRLYGGYTDATSETGFANDTIEGGDGSDSLYGGIGDDLLIGQNNADWILGGRGNDTLIGCFLGIATEAGNGADTIFGENGVDRIFGGDGDDNLSGGNDNDEIYGDDGNDSIWGAFSNSNVETGNTSDTIQGGNGSDTISGGYGNDFLTGGNGNDNIRGDSANDTIWGAFPDSPNETAGNRDTLTGGQGSDTIYGGQGNDFLDGGIPNPNAEVGVMNDFLDGGDGHDTIWGGEGNDTLTGGHGMDILMGESGIDDMDGGLRGPDPEIGFAADFLDGGPGYDLMWGGEDNDTLTGGLGSDTLNGESGGDLLDGGLPFATSEGAFGSWDLLDGGTGNDLLWGGEGNDTVTGGEGRDTIFGEAGSDLLDAGLPGFVDPDFNDEQVDGGPGRDTLWGGEGNDTLKGMEGNDILNGEDGNDVLYAGAGTDTLFGGNGQDGLFGGTLDGRDDLYGGPDPDRLLSADDNDLDRAPEDALIHFMGDGTFNFNDAEIEQLDKGFAWLQLTRGNPALLKLQDQRVIKFQRVGGFENPKTLADNNNDGTIRMGNWAFEPLMNPMSPRHNIPPEATALHELGHNWDGKDDEDGGMEDFIENEWHPLSGWEPDDFTASGKELSQDGEWRYSYWAEFVRDYGNNNPMDDWCTTWEASYVWSNYLPNSAQRGEYKYVGTELKIELVNHFLTGNF